MNKCAKLFIASIVFTILSSAFCVFAFADVSGTCGEGLAWTFSDQGKLTITGLGTMTDYSYKKGITTAPWGNYALSINEVELTNGITNIGGYAFFGCSNLSNVIIPDSVTSIGNYAFNICSALMDITLPDSVTNIGEYAFCSCTCLMSITIPNHLTTIDNGTFAGCSNVVSIVIPDSVTSIGEYAFQGCNGLTDLIIPNSVISIGNRAFFGCASLESITIPENVTSIGEYMFFSCGSLSTITIPSSVTSIGNNAFDNCANLADVYYGGTSAQKETLNIMANNSYLIDATWHLTICAGGHVNIIEDAAVEATCETSGKTAGSHCAACGTVIIAQRIIPAGHDWDETTYTWAEDNSTVTASRVCRRNDSHIETETVITTNEITLQPTCDNTGLAAYTSKPFENKAFSVQTKANIRLNALGHMWDSPTYTWAGDNSTITARRICKREEKHIETETVTVNSEIVPATCEANGRTFFTSTAFENKAFSNQTKIIEDTPALGHEWGEVVYTWADDNTSVTATRVCQRNETHIETETVGVTSEITKPATYDELGETTYTSGTFQNNAFETQTKTLKDIDLIPHVSIIDYSPSRNIVGFGDRITLTILVESNVSIEDSISGTCYMGNTSKAMFVFFNRVDDTNYFSCSFVIPSNNNMYVGKWYVARMYANYSKDGYDSSVEVMTNSINIEFTVVKTPSYGGFSYSPNATANTCSIIGYNGTDSEVVVPDRIYEYRVVKVNKSTFSGNQIITSVNLPNSITSIEDHSFSGCTELKSITIPDSVLTIGAYAFKECINMTSVTIPESVTNVGNYAFEGCSSLSDLYIGTIESWLAISFGNSYSFPNLFAKKWYINDNLITSIVIPDSVTSIGDHAFYNCSSLTNITIPDSVTSIGDHAFYNCSSLTNITIPDSVTSIGEWAFYNCNNLTRIAIPNSVSSIGSYAFGNCSCLRFVTIPEGVISIRERAFYYCNNLTSITIPNTITSIEKSAFYGCKSLTSVTIPNQVSSIGTYAFYGCINLRRVCISSVSITFGDDVFNFSPTIYCYEYSDAEAWATENGYTVVLLDYMSLNSIRSVTLPEDLWIGTDETSVLDVYIFPSYDNPEVILSNTDPDIVSLENGVITGISCGTTTIVATVGTVSDSMQINVYASVESFELNTSEVWLIAKQPLQMTILNQKPEGLEAAFAWSSSDIDLATVDENGFVTTKKPGNVTITATSKNGISRECLIHLCYPVTAIDLQPSAVTIKTNKTAKLTANVTMRTQNCVNRLVTFSSSDESIATVDENGIVTGHNVGTTIITATAESGVTAMCNVVVQEANLLTLPSDLTTIDSEAFANLGSVDAIRIPMGVTSIADDAFDGSNIILYVRSGSYAAEWAENHGFEVIVE